MRNNQLNLAITVVWLLSIFLAFSCGGGGGGGPAPITPNPQQPATSTATISGYLYEYNPGEAIDPILGAASGYSPVSSVSVSAGGKSTSTSQEGWFTIGGVPITATEVQFTKANYSSLTKAITLTANQTLTLSSKGSAALCIHRISVGSLALTSAPAGARISLNGTRTDRSTPTTFANMPTGTYKITVSRDGYLPSSRDIVISTGNAEINLTLTSASGSISANPGDPPAQEPFVEREPGSFAGPAVTPATAGERILLAAADGQITGNLVSTSGVKVYKELVQGIVDGYNADIAPLVVFGDLPMVSAVYQTGIGAPVSGKIDVYYTGYDPSISTAVQIDRWNARAGFEAIYLYDNLFLSIDEATALMFFVDDENEWLYYQGLATYYGQLGQPFSIVPASLRDELVMDPQLGEAYCEIAGSGMVAVGLHELGHVNLGHTLQKVRLANASSLTAAIVNNTALNWPFEFQADIFSAHAMRESDCSLSGSMVMCLMFYSAELQDTTPLLLMTHPPAEMRGYIYMEVDEGADLLGYLYPLLPDLKNFASASPYGVTGRLKDTQLPMLSPILGSKRTSVAPELISRTPRIPTWFLDKYGK